VPSEVCGVSSRNIGRAADLQKTQVCPLLAEPVCQHRALGGKRGARGEIGTPHVAWPHKGEAEDPTRIQGRKRGPCRTRSKDGLASQRRQNVASVPGLASPVSRGARRAPVGGRVSRVVDMNSDVGATRLCSYWGRMEVHRCQTAMVPGSFCGVRM
jgi:hypothetical protein